MRPIYCSQGYPLVKYCDCCFAAQGRHYSPSHRTKWNAKGNLSQVAHLKKFKRHLQDSSCLASVASNPLALASAITWLQVGDAGPICALTLVSITPFVVVAHACCLLYSLPHVHHCCSRTRSKCQLYRQRKQEEITLFIDQVPFCSFDPECQQYLEFRQPKSIVR